MHTTGTYKYLCHTIISYYGRHLWGGHATDIGLVYIVSVSRRLYTDLTLWAVLHEAIMCLGLEAMCHVLSKRKCDSNCKKTREFECQMFRFSVAPCLTRHSPCRPFPEHLVCLASMSERNISFRPHIIAEYSHKNKSFFFIFWPEHSFFKLKIIFEFLKLENFSNNLSTWLFFLFFSKVLLVSIPSTK